MKSFVKLNINACYEKGLFKNGGLTAYTKLRKWTDTKYVSVSHKSRRKDC
jgi:hypothetical protein